MKKILSIVVLIFLVKSNFYAQALTVTSATACPNQPVTLVATWNNVGSTTYTIYKSPTSFTPQTSPNFVVGDNGAGPFPTINYTIVGAGQNLSGPVTATTTATLTIVTPAPLTITQPNNNSAYCYGGTATLTAPLGSVNYTLNGPPGTNFPVYNNNIINVPNLVSPLNIGQYTVTANMSGCVRTGVVFIDVSPNSSLTVSQSTTTCQSFTITLTANVPNVTLAGYTWSHPSLNTTAPTITLSNIQPSQAGVYNVNANFSYGTAPSSTTCPVSGSVNVSVVQTSTPVISASPSGTLCQGANLTLAASITNGNPQSFSWAGPNGFSASSQNPTIANTSTLNSGTYTVTAIFSNGFAVCTTTTTAPVQIIGTIDPTITGPSNVCEGPSSSFTISASAAGAGSFSWNNPGPPLAAINATQSTHVVTPVTQANSGIYYATAYFGSLQCPRTRSLAVNVIPVNTISVIPPTDVCQPDNAYLQASAVGATTFTWDGPNGNVGYTANTILYYPPVTASGIYTITMGFGNSALTCYNSATVSLLVKPLLNFTLSPLTQIVCYNSPVQINGPAGATSYSWTSSSGYTTNTQNINFPSAQPFNGGTYYLSVSLNGCVTSGTAALTVLDPIQFTQPFFDRSICRGDSIYMEAHVTGGSQDNIAFTWNPCVNLSACTGSVTRGLPAGTTIYQVQAYDVLCASYTISAAIKVEVKQPPKSRLELARNEGCAPLCMNYNTATTESSAWVTYDFGENLKYQQDSFDLCLKNPGTYNLKVTLTGTNGCSGTYTYPEPIIVHPKPELSVVTNPESPTVTDEVVFTAATNYSVASQTWIISPPGAEPDTLTIPNPVKYFQNAGTYPVFLTAITDMGCTDTTVRYLEIRDDFNVFIPNSFTPNDDGVNDVFAVKGSGIKAEFFTMDVMNRKGQTVYSTRDLDAGWDGTFKGSKAQQDVYVYKITVVGAHSEGKKQYIGQFSLLR